VLSVDELKMEVVERKRSRGGFLNLFDWHGKSRKKLFSGSTSELSGLFAVLLTNS